MMTRMALPTPTLHTDRLRLRPFDDADADALYALQSNAHVLRYSPPWFQAEGSCTDAHQTGYGRVTNVLTK